MTKNIQFPETMVDLAFSISEDTPGRSVSLHRFLLDLSHSTIGGRTCRRGERIYFHRYFPLWKFSGVKV